MSVDLQFIENLHLEFLTNGFLEIWVANPGAFKPPCQYDHKQCSTFRDDFSNAITSWLQDHGLYLVDVGEVDLTEAPILTNQSDEQLRRPADCWVFSTYMTEDWCDALVSRGSVRFTPMAMVGI